MSLIIKDKIQQMFVGYPTKAQNYNVAGGVLKGSAAHFGDLVCFNGDGYYRPFASGDTIDDIAGFILATNIKQAEGFGTNVVQVNPNEAFNLALYDTYMSVEVTVASSAATEIVPKAKVYADATTGKITTVSTSNIELPGVIFTGLWEEQGSKIVAEIYIK